MQREREMRVTTTLPETIWLEAKKAGIPVRQLILRGWQAEQDFPALRNRIGDTEEKMRRYQFELEQLSKKYYDLKEGKR